MNKPRRSPQVVQGRRKRNNCKLHWLHWNDCIKICQEDLYDTKGAMMESQSRT